MIREKRRGGIISSPFSSISGRGRVRQLQKFTRANFLFGKVGATNDGGSRTPGGRWEEVKREGMEICASWAQHSTRSGLNFNALLEVSGHGEPEENCCADWVSKTGIKRVQ